MSESEFLRKRLTAISDTVGGYTNAPASETVNIEELARELIDQRERKAIGVVKKTKTAI
ncbi:MAG TPA: hypothetical protein GXZ25_11460 [Peptococcaceae bacterium]|jgi:hypothetical protein|nr:hypothetical protein [Peptococcaceae bacterium]